jgi:hypothetical protein
MRGLLTLAVALFTATVGANAQTFLGFRLLNLGGGTLFWSKGPDEAAKDAGPLTVTYAFVTSELDSPNARNCRSIGPIDTLLSKSQIDKKGLQREVRAAFDMWETAANIRFSETADASKAGILIGAQLVPEGRAFADVSSKAGTGERGLIERSLICLNPDQRWKIGFDGNLTVYDLRYTFAHEIGHAIGLDHPSPSGELMSFRYDEKFRSLQEGDIAGAVSLYGRPRPTEQAAHLAQ